MTRKLSVLNGPNLDMLGEREPALYGSATLADVEQRCADLARDLDFDLVFAQTNAEYEMIAWLHDAYRDGAAVVINPAGFSFRSIPVLDAVRMLVTPVIEIHITNIHGRDLDHRHSLISAVATTVIAGAGVFGYELAIRAADSLTTA